MINDDEPTYYEILDLRPEASPQEVREAYLRTKSAYNKDSLALYTLVSVDEREQMIQKIEEAYSVLSNPDRRKEYDMSHGTMTTHDELFSTRSSFPQNDNVVSIDRVPPMEPMAGSEDLLIAPSTDIGELPHGDEEHAKPSRPSKPSFSPPNATTPPPPPPSSFSGPPVPPPAPSLGRVPSPAIEYELQQEIADQLEWKGSFLRKIRETRRVSVEELASSTKISKTYLLAIEDENFGKLPAAVFLRGFLNQISRELKLPAQKVIPAFMVRYLQARPDQAR